MELTLDRKSPFEVQADALIVLEFEEQSSLPKGYEPMREAGELKGKLKEFALLHHVPGYKAHRILVAGAGMKKSFHSSDLRTVIAASVRFLKARHLGKASLVLPEDLSTPEHVSAASEGAILGDFECDRLKSDHAEDTPLASFHIVVDGGGDDLEAGLKRGRILAESQNFARALGNANIAVYPINAFGLTVGGSSESQYASADMIATESGGRAIFNSNGMVDHLKEIVAETSDAYQMGYYPGDKAWDGKYHKIELKLTPQHKGMKVLCRRGYYAMDERVDPTSDRAFIEATRSVVEAPDIGMTLNVTSNPLHPGPEDVVLRMNVQDLYFDQSSQRARTNLDVAFVQYGRDGLVLQSFKDNIRLGLQKETWMKASQKGLFYPKKLTIVEGAEKVRVVVRDLATGSIGSVSVPVQSPF